MATVTRRISVNWGVTGATLFYAVLDQDNANLIARTSTSVAEFPAGSKQYSVKVTTWDVDWIGRVVWDDGTNYASENFDKMPTLSVGTMTLTDASLTTAKLGTFVLAKTTNISGFNDIAATAIVSSGAINTSGGAVTTTTNLTNAPTSGDFTSTMKTSLNAATPAVTVSDKTGFSLSAAGVLAIWNSLTSALTTAGSIGKRLVDFVTTLVYATPGTPLDAAATRAALGMASPNLDTQLGTLATASAVTTIGGQVSNMQSTLSSMGGTLNTLDAKLGGFSTGNGNDVLGFLRSMSRDDLPAPSDMGGTFDPSTRSLQGLTLSGGGLDAAATRAALGMASANLDTQLGAVGAQTVKIGTNAADSPNDDTMQATVALNLDAKVSEAGGDGGGSVSVTQKGVSVTER